MARKRTPRAILRDRVKYLRRKQTSGKELTPDELAEVEHFEASKNQPGNDEPDDASELGPQPDDHAVGVAAEGSAEALADSTPLPDPPRLPRPPRVTAAAPESEPDHKRAASKSDWRDKYRTDGQAEGREKTVTVLADQIIAILEVAAESCKQAGINPIVNPESLRSAWVLTLDDVLPDKVRVTPQMVAVGGSTLLLGQRFVNRKVIAEAQAVAEARKNHDEYRTRQSDRADEHAKDSPAVPEPRIVVSQPPADGPPPSAAPATQEAAPIPASIGDSDDDELESMFSNSVKPKNWDAVVASQPDVVY